MLINVCLWVCFGEFQVSTHLAGLCRLTLCNSSFWTNAKNCEILNHEILSTCKFIHLCYIQMENIFLMLWMTKLSITELFYLEKKSHNLDYVLFCSFLAMFHAFCMDACLNFERIQGIFVCWCLILVIFTSLRNILVVLRNIFIISV